MNASNSSLNVKRLILVPALIALAVTMIRLLGELGQGPSFLFSREAGGPGALIGIVWLIPLFGIYFAVKLVRGNQAPQSAGRVIGMAVLSLVVALAGIVLVVGVATGYAYIQGKKIAPSGGNPALAPFSVHPDSGAYRPGG